MPTLAIMHTTTTTIDPLKFLAAELLPDCTVVNFVDDTILPRLEASGGNLAEVEERIVRYARFAEEAGADVVLEACSSVGDLAELVQRSVQIPIIRIDEAVAALAVQRGPRIGVAATLAPTLGPVVRLLAARAQAAGTAVAISSMLVADAYQKLLDGDREGHDALLSAALTDLIATVDSVVFCHVSLARVLPRLPEASREKCLHGARLALERVGQVLASQRAHPML